MESQRKLSIFAKNKKKKEIKVIFIKIYILIKKQKRKKKKLDFKTEFYKTKQINEVKISERYITNPQLKKQKIKKSFKKLCEENNQNEIEKKNKKISSQSKFTLAIS